MELVVPPERLLSTFSLVRFDQNYTVTSSSLDALFNLHHVVSCSVVVRTLGVPKVPLVVVRAREYTLKTGFLKSEIISPPVFLH